MTKVGILVEKPSAKQNFMKALGGEKGTFNKENFIIVNAVGHLYQLQDVEHQVNSSLKDKYKSWNIDNLPWNKDEIKWKYSKSTGKSDVIKNIVSVLSKCDEIVIATDLDPTGEGDLLAAEIIFENKLDNKKITRMKFVDESEKSIQKAFIEREHIVDLKKDLRYLKALFRSKWDYLSIQFTRIATKMNGKNYVLRQGRLKSSMVSLVGKALDDLDKYEAIPYYENKFKDNKGVIYTSKKEIKHPTKDSVVNSYTDSKVIVESTEIKRTIPPKLLDLSQLSSTLSSRGYKASTILSTYQKMYEAGIVSYPRTEDKTITHEQFNEMLPLVDKIALLVGVNTSLLTHRKPRASHVINKGAHGANRPGLTVPNTLEELSKYGTGAKEIYKLLAKSFLSMFGEDFEYEHQKGFLEKYPDFKGFSNKPLKQGWKEIIQKTDDENDESTSGLGEIAKPFIYEGFPPKPPQPTMKWLMKQLEKYDVGTGATRTSTFVDITSEKQKFPLLVSNKGKIDITNYGKISYQLLQNTKIGDIKTSEYVLKTLKEIGEGKTELADVVLNEISHLVEHDIHMMRENSSNIKFETKEINKKEKETFVDDDGNEISFNKEWGGHTFTEEEINRLKSGETIELKNLKNKKGKTYNARGRLEKQKFKGKTFYGFKLIEFF